VHRAQPAQARASKLRAALGWTRRSARWRTSFSCSCASTACPRPRTNIDVAGDKVDCHWPQQGLTVELLSYRFHASRRAFEADVARRRRSRHLAFTWGDVFERGEQTIAELRAAYAGS